MNAQKAEAEIDRIAWRIAFLQCKRPSKDVEEKINGCYKRLEKIKKTLMADLETGLNTFGHQLSLSEGKKGE